MQVEVYEREIDAVEAAAEEVAARIAAAGEGAVVALPGGRRGRALLAALAEQASVPWASTRWFVTDEACGDAAAPDSARELVVSTMLAPNRVPASALAAPERGAPAADAARDYEAAVRAVADARGGFDVVLLAAGPDGAVAGLAPGDAAAGWVVVGGAGRVSIGANALAAARAVVVVATGGAVQACVREALTAAPDPVGRPLQQVLPASERVRWFVDRTAVASLLDEARVVEDEQPA